jgi:site-specific recombinase XerC
MTVTDDPEYKVKRSRERLGKAEIGEQNKELIREFLDAINPDITTVTLRSSNGEQETKSYATVAAYCQSLKRFCELSEQSLTDFETVDDINELFQSFMRGTHPNVKDDGYGKSTLGQWQSAVTKFYEYHEQFGIDPEEVVVTPPDTSTVDERDMFTREEVEEMRDAVTNVRDRCLLELFLNTGQRIRAIQTLRVKDVDPDEGIYYLNTDASGLKGADKNGRKRPLLGAARPVHDWLKNHQGDPDDFLITSLTSTNAGNHGEKLSQDNIRSRLRKIADDAGVNKPPNPHNFRHYFVTFCKRNYNMDDATIKHLIGHGAGSNIMETTYQHLSDEDYIKDAEIAADLREEEVESPLTPAVCPTCGDNLAPDARACSGCGTVFTPDAKAAEDQIDEQIKESYKDTDPEDSDTQEKIDQLDDLLDDPDVKAALLEKLQE